uniref:Uncharacterized protein n=1 Tax=Anguilla anguilla TaxID=7936 RepID=A0A0E9TCG0_ANGAN
MFVCVFHVDHS